MSEIANLDAVDDVQVQRWGMMLASGFAVATAILLAIEFFLPSASVNGPYLTPPWTSISGGLFVALVLGVSYGATARLVGRSRRVPVAFLVTPALASILWILPSTYAHQAELMTLVEAVRYGFLPWWLPLWAFGLLYVFFLVPLSAGRVTVRFYRGQPEAVADD